MAAADLSSATAEVAVDDGGLLLPAAEPLLPEPPIIFFANDTITATITMCSRVVYISTDDGRGTTREVDAEFLHEYSLTRGGGSSDGSIDHSGGHDDDLQYNDKL